MSGSRKSLATGGKWWQSTSRPERACELVTEVVHTRIPRKFGLRRDDIQVLSPMYRGAVGVTNLNRQLQQALNPPAQGKPERQDWRATPEDTWRVSPAGRLQCRTSKLRFRIANCELRIHRSVHRPEPHIRN